MDIIILKNNIYKIHFLYNEYAASLNGKIININIKKPLIGSKNHCGYLSCCVKSKNCDKQKTIQCHRFIWECWCGVIPKGKVIDHCNDDKEDNRLCNLQLMTQQENCLKSAKKRDYSFVSNNHKNRKCVKAINKTTGETTYFNSMYSIEQHLGINCGLVKMAAEGLNYCKSARSNIDGHSYTFKYIKKEDLPANFKKSANIRPKKYTPAERKKVQQEQIRRWQNKDWICKYCEKVLKNLNKYNHQKRCNIQVFNIINK